MRISKLHCAINIVTVSILLNLAQHNHLFSRFCSQNYAFDSGEYQIVNPGEHVLGCARRNLHASVVLPGYFYLLEEDENYVDTNNV